MRKTVILTVLILMSLTTNLFSQEKIWDETDAQKQECLQWGGHMIDFVCSFIGASIVWC